MRERHFVEKKDVLYIAIYILLHAIRTVTFVGGGGRNSSTLDCLEGAGFALISVQFVIIAGAVGSLMNRRKDRLADGRKDGFVAVSSGRRGE